MNQSRVHEIFKLCCSGAKYEEIADSIGVSRQRAHQLVGSLGMRQLRDLEAKRKSLTAKAEASRERQDHRDRKYSGLSAKEFYEDSLMAEQKVRLSNKGRNAKQAGIEFALQHGDLEWPEYCPVLGIKLDYYCSPGVRNEASASFDRADSTLGYVKGNVRIISWRANRIKNDGTAEEHRRIADYIDSL